MPGDEVNQRTPPHPRLLSLPTRIVLVIHSINHPSTGLGLLAAHLISCPRLTTLEARCSSNYRDVINMRRYFKRESRCSLYPNKVTRVHIQGRTIIVVRLIHLVCGSLLLVPTRPVDQLGAPKKRNNKLTSRALMVEWALSRSLFNRSLSAINCSLAFPGTLRNLG